MHGATSKAKGKIELRSQNILFSDQVHSEQETYFVFSYIDVWYTDLFACAFTNTNREKLLNLKQLREMYV